MAEATFKIVYKTTTGEYLTTDIVFPDGLYGPEAENKIMAEYKDLDKIIGRFKITNIIYYDENAEKYLINLDEENIAKLVDTAITTDKKENEWHKRVKRVSWMYYVPQFILGGIFVVLSMPFLPFYLIFEWTQKIAGMIFEFFENRLSDKRGELWGECLEEIKEYGYRLEEKVQLDQIKKDYPDFYEKIKK